MAAFSLQGIFISRVTEAGPCGLAGLQVGDKLLSVIFLPDSGYFVFLKFNFDFFLCRVIIPR